MNLREFYFDWICDLIDSSKDELQLLYLLNSIPFSFIDPLDGNRYEDGIDLRYRFGYAKGISSVGIANELDIYPCSVLEVMVSLAIKCEELMQDPDVGSQVPTFFEGMLESIGLIQYRHYISDPQTVEALIKRLLDRKYDPDGKGGLFTIPGCHEDLRQVEIWKQMMWYLSYISGQ